jgi:hypothetical protein
MSTPRENSAEPLLTMETPNLHIDPALKKAAERAAAHDHRSLKSLIENLLTDHLRRTAYLPRSAGADEGLRPNELTSDNNG